MKLTSALIGVLHPRLRGTSAADALVTALMAWAAGESALSVRLHVIARNDRARRFYERNGFSVTGRETVRERDGACEIEMHRPLV